MIVSRINLAGKIPDLFPKQLTSEGYNKWSIYKKLPILGNYLGGSPIPLNHKITPLQISKAFVAMAKLASSISLLPLFLFRFPFASAYEDCVPMNASFYSNGPSQYLVNFHPMKTLTYETIKELAKKCDAFPIPNRASDAFQEIQSSICFTGDYAGGEAGYVDKCSILDLSQLNGTSWLNECMLTAYKSLCPDPSPPKIPRGVLPTLLTLTVVCSFLCYAYKNRAVPVNQGNGHAPLEVGLLNQEIVQETQ